MHYGTIGKYKCFAGLLSYQTAIYRWGTRDQGKTRGEGKDFAMNKYERLKGYGQRRQDVYKEQEKGCGGE